QQLRKIEIGPEHVEGKKQLAEVVEVAFADEPRVRLEAGEQHYRDDHQAHGGDRLATDEDETVNCGGPVRRDGHDPIDGSEGHCENIENDAGSGSSFEAQTQYTVFRAGILHPREGIEQENKEKPDREVDDRPD